MYNKHASRLIVATSLLVYSLAGWSDWADPADPRNVHVSPAAGVDVRQNPPDFDWSRLNISTEYQLLVRHQDGKQYQWRTTRNWYSPAISFPPGNYSWQVQPVGPGAERGASDWRKFRISDDAVSFVVPEDEALLTQLRNKPRPRSLFIGKDEASWRTMVLAQRRDTVDVLNGQVHKGMARPSLGHVPELADRNAGSGERWAASLFAIRGSVTDETRQLRAAAILWRITRDPALLTEALKRGDALAALDPNGSTGHKSQDQASRDIAISLASAFDWLGDEVPADSKTRWLQAIASRGQAIREDLLGGQRRFDVSHYDSHGWTNLCYLANISMLMVGSLPEAENWFRESFRFYIHTVSPWGSEEGGWANASAYANWSLDQVIVPRWDSIHAATGINVYTKPWSQGFLKYFAYFVPPGSPRHLFGDGAETAPNFGLIKGFASRQHSSLAAWYARNLTNKEDLINLLAAPIPLPVDGVQVEPPKENSLAFHDIGWVAMHSAIADRSRTSIYFRASPYAAFSHSHADNNSFVLVSGGEPLLIDSGYYDWYGSPHWKGWYWRTKAHNAVTFDGGKGQAEKSGPERMTAVGRLVDFHTDGKVDFTEGDASAAYEGELFQARRRLWYLRNENVLVIHDSLRSAVPRQFEWNIHALDTFVVKGSGSVEVKQNAARACIDMLQPSGIEFVQNNRFDPPPQSAPARKDQWHGRFQNTERQTSLEFLAVIKVGCRAVPLEINNFATNRTIKVGDQTLNIPR
ncbi:MAG: heparinase II/III family protein [Nitrosospira sp.]